MKKSNQVYEMYSFQLFAVVLYTRASTGPGTGPCTGPGLGFIKISGIQVLTGPGL